MNIEKTAEKIFKMSDDVWERHVNPWSVWTRYSCLPLLCLAVWSRVWIGWMCLIPIVMVCFWTWFNPRIFKKPDSINNWASKAVLGERIFLNQSKTEIPKHHLRALNVIKVITSIGFICAIYGLIALHVWLTVFGTVITMMGKTWFLDRMVWLYQDMNDRAQSSNSE